MKIWMTILLGTWLFAAATPPHIEMVAEVDLEQIGDQLQLEVRLDKRYLVAGLREDVDCEPAEMLKICAPDYFWSQFSISADGAVLEPTATTRDLTQQALILRYSIDLPEDTEKLTVFSSYLQKHIAHARVRLFARHGTQVKSYDLHSVRRMIHIPLKSTTP